MRLARLAVGALLLGATLAHAQTGGGSAEQTVSDGVPAATTPLPPKPIQEKPATEAAGTAASAPATPAQASPVIVDWIGRTVTVPQSTEVFAAPASDAASAGTLVQGANVDVVGVVQGREWLKLRLPDGSFGYARSANIPTAASQPPPLQDATAQSAVSAPEDELAAGPVQGSAIVLNTATLVFSNQAVFLYAIDGFGGEPALAMQQYLDSIGHGVACDPVEKKGFICTLHDGTDVAKAALINGAARATPDAPPDYVAQETSAKQAKRGIWRDGGAKLEAVAFSNSTVTDPDSFVPGVPYAGPDGIPPRFAAAQPVDGLALLDGQPFTLDEGVPTPVLYEPGVGWGFWDRYFVWRRAPVAWIPLLNRSHPRGTNLRQIDLAAYGFVINRPYFIGPAVDYSFIPDAPPIAVGFSPYPAPAFVPFLRRGFGPAGFGPLGPRPGGAFPAGFAPGMMRPGPGGFERGGFERGGFERGGFERGGFGPGGMRPGGFGAGMPGMRPGPGGFAPGGMRPGGFAPGGMPRMAGPGGPIGPGRGAFGVRPLGGGMMPAGGPRFGGGGFGRGGFGGGMPMAGRPVMMGGGPRPMPNFGGGRPMGGGSPPALGGKRH